MPSLALSDKKEEKKMMKKKIALETTPELDSKKGKKESKLKLSDSDGESSEKKKSKKKEKKRKAAEIGESEEEAKSDSSSELVDPESSKSEKKKSSKKVKLGVEDVDVDNPNAVSKFRISAPLREKLKEKGIEALFPIQAMSFDMVLDGTDIVGRARTGQVLVTI